jgi:hypothetical protein
MASNSSNKIMIRKRDCIVCGKEFIKKKICYVTCDGCIKERRGRLERTNRIKKEQRLWLAEKVSSVQGNHRREG